MKKDVVQIIGGHTANLQIKSQIFKIINFKIIKSLILFTFYSNKNIIRKKKLFKM